MVQSNTATPLSPAGWQAMLKTDSTWMLTGSKMKHPPPSTVCQE
ncbi:hypothetical protein RK21_05261 [Pseudomonas plecoglossicida]|nr:hypothetical protein RK21_05261 [Pseudomonas plecoglossicida]